MHQRPRDILERLLTDAEKALLWLRGDVVDASSELATIQVNIQNSRLEHVDCNSVLLPKLIKPIFLTCTLMFSNRFSGVVAFNFYAVTIFSQVFSDINPHLGAVVQLIASFAYGILSEKLGRRLLLMITGIIMSMALSAFGFFALYKDSVNIQDNPSFDYIPLFCVLMFECAFSAGVQPVSWLLLGELFPLEFRAQGTSFTTAFSYLCAFLGVKTYVDLTNLFGLYGTFWTYAVTTFVGVMFYCTFVPETREEPLQEMRVRTSKPSIHV